MSDTFVVDLENTPIPSSAASVYVVDLAHSADQMCVIFTPTYRAMLTK